MSKPESCINQKLNKPESCINQTPEGVWFIQDSGLFRGLVYTGFWFIQGFGLYMILVYSGFGLYRILVINLNLV
jgi:hypothetical protein